MLELALCLMLRCSGDVVSNLSAVKVNLYSGALFIQQALHWNIYGSVLLLLAATAITTVTGSIIRIMHNVK